MGNTYQNKLREMVNDAGVQSEDIQGNIDGIQAQVDELQDKMDAVKYGMMDPIMYDLTAFLDIKMVELGGVEVVYGADFGDINITDFRIIDATAVDLYSYMGGLYWDDSPDVIEWVRRWNWGYDYIVKEMDFDGTYGLKDQKDKLESSLTLLNNNKTKITESATNFEEFAS